jgi:glycosyltransferase involved in cell wall biosynthesis
MSGPKKKVMILIKGLGAGGAEKLLSTSIPYLNRECYDYEVAYLLPHKNDLVHEFQEAGIPVFCINGQNPYDPRSLFRMVKLLKERRIDLIHIHLPYTGIFGRIAARLANVEAIVYTEHNVIDGYKPVTRLLDRLTYRFDKATITVSDSVRESVLRSKLFKPNNVVTVLNGVDTRKVNLSYFKETSAVRESFGIPREDFVVGNIAHIRPLKGHRYLLQAAKIVIEDCPNTTFLIVGREKTREAREALEAQATQLGIREKIIFTGFREDAIRILAACDLFVLSSLYEGLPVALLEAMALGKPPVVTAVGGIPEVVTDGVDGFLVQPRDYEGLANRIIALIRDGELRGQISGRAAKKIEEKFSLRDMIGRVEDIYNQVLSAA